MVEKAQVQEYTRKAVHEKMMKNAGCDIEKLIAFRHDVHQNAEIGFKEFETQKKVKAMLLSYGIDESNIKPCAGTGLVVDIHGTGEAGPESGVKTVAFRADMDALPIPENNPDLPYKTTTPYAHMCGHDGHMATLLAAAQVLQNRRDRIPKGKTVRLLFQPAEEGPGGALPMIKEGCLEGVDEVYGYHNVPNFDEGDVRVIEGAIMSRSIVVRIKVFGKGGHGSAPH